MTSMRRRYVASTSLRRHVPTRFLINQCQIITVLILKSDFIENSRIELRGIVLPVQVGGLLGGPKGMLAPPSQIIGGPGPPCPPPPLFLIKASEALYWFHGCSVNVSCIIEEYDGGNACLRFHENDFLAFLISF